MAAPRAKQLLLRLLLRLDSYRFRYLHFLQCHYPSGDHCNCLLLPTATCG